MGDATGRRESREGGSQGDRGAVSKPFRWDDSESFSAVPHFGVPMELDFDWQIMGPGKLDLPQKKASVQLFVKNVEKAGA